MEDATTGGASRSVPKKEPVTPPTGESKLVHSKHQVGHLACGPITSHDISLNHVHHVINVFLLGGRY